MFYFNSAADDLQKIGYDLAFEDSVIAGFKAVERFSAHGNYCLKFGVSAELTGRESRVALNYIKLSPFGIFRTARNKLFNS